MTLHICRNRHCRHRRPVKEAGVSLIELLMVVAVGGTLAGISIMGFAQAATSMRGDNGMVQVMSQLRMARDLAINQRRTMEIEFLAPNEIRITRQEIPSGTTLMNQFFLEGTVQFVQFSGVPDTPDGFGNGSELDFDSVNDMGFLGDGMLVDLSNPAASGTPISGTVFLGIPNQPASARAVTVFGGTGRVRGYTWIANEWRE